MRLKAEIRGVDDIQRLLGRKAANRLHRRIEDDVKEGVYAMAEQAYQNAPVETGALRNSILANVFKVGDMEYIFGSNMPYARRQEYEHKSKKFYLHRAVRQEQGPLYSKILFTIRHTLGG